MKLPTQAKPVQRNMSNTKFVDSGTALSTGQGATRLIIQPAQWTTGAPPAQDNDLCRNLCVMCMNGYLPYCEQLQTNHCAGWQRCLPQG
ncbi:MAG: hypothetical protein U0350_10135 [Caldilineaceae bacterium]